MSSQPMASAVNYPCPLEVNVSNYVPLKLDKTNYSVWKKLMLNLITSHQLDGFIDGTIERPRLPSELRLWIRSDGLVKGWIFVTVTEEILLKKQVRLNAAGEFEEVISSSDESGSEPVEAAEEILEAAEEIQVEAAELVSLKTAREVWIALENILDPSDESVVIECEDEVATMIASRYLPLYWATRNGDWENATKFLDQEPDAVRDAISYYSETALMLAVRSSKRNPFLMKLMERMLPEDVERADDFGQTALHKALESGNNVAAKLLVKKNPKLLNIKDKYDDNPELPVHYAARDGNREMVNYLMEVTKMDGDQDPFKGQLGLQLLNNLIQGELYDIALTFLQSYPMLASMEPHPLMKVSERPTSFRSGTRLNFFQDLIYSGIPRKLEENANKPVRRDVENSADSVVSPLVSQKLHAMFWDVAEKLVPKIKLVRETKLIHHQALMFVKHLCEEVLKSESSKADDIFRNALVRAATLGACEVVEEILEVYPNGIKAYRSSDMQSLFQVAIENRQENVFNIIYQLDENQNIFLSWHDKFQNNALHTAGNLGYKQQLSLQANVAGAALQLQRELQWFKAVEKLLHLPRRYKRNNKGKTPQDVFTETHKELVEKGEKWMKDTASSCTIAAALIVTVVCAAAITVPGGMNNVDGLPIFLEDRVFFLFGMFNALALFSSIASLLMFLSIFTSCYGEQDFLYLLPKKLIIGMVTLFVSVISMMIAFGATLKIVFGHKREWVVIPAVVISSVPITLFSSLQFPFLVDIIQSTYCPDIFRKRSNHILY